MLLCAHNDGEHLQMSDPENEHDLPWEEVDELDRHVFTDAMNEGDCE